MRRRTLRARLGAALIGMAVVLVATGCVTLQRAPVTPLVVTFATTSLPFTVEPYTGNGGASANGAAANGAAANGAVAGDACVVRRVDVTLREVRRDTVFFDALRAHTPAPHFARCAWTGPGLIALAGQPQVRSETAEWSMARTLLVGAAVVPMIIALAFGFLVLGGAIW